MQALARKKPYRRPHCSSVNRISSQVRDTASSACCLLLLMLLMRLMLMSLVPAVKSGTKLPHPFLKQALLAVVI